MSETRHNPQRDEPEATPVRVVAKKDGSYKAYDRVGKEIPGLGMFLYHTKQRFKFGQTEGETTEKYSTWANYKNKEQRFVTTGHGKNLRWEDHIPDGEIPEKVFLKKQCIIRLAAIGKWKSLDLVKTFYPKDYKDLIQTLEMLFQRDRIPNNEGNKDVYKSAYEYHSYKDVDISSLGKESGRYTDLSRANKFPSFAEFDKEEESDWKEFLEENENYPYAELHEHLLEHIIKPALETNAHENRVLKWIKTVLFVDKQIEKKCLLRGNRSCLTTWAEKRIAEEDQELLRKSANKNKYHEPEDCSGWRWHLFKTVLVYNYNHDLRSKDSMLRTIAFKADFLLKEIKKTYRWKDHVRIVWNSTEEHATPLPISEVRKVLNSGHTAGVAKVLFYEKKPDYHNRGNTPATIWDNLEEKPGVREYYCTVPNAAAALLREGLKGSVAMLQKFIDSVEKEHFHPKCMPAILKTLSKHKGIDFEGLDELKKRWTNQLI